MAKQMQAAGWEGFHQTTISRIEKGDRPVRLSEASGIALVLGVEMWQMVLADEASRPLRELEKSIEQLRRLGLILGENVRDYLFYQSLIRKELDDIDELTWGAEGHGFNPQFIQKRDELKMAAARLLSRTYMEDIDEFMRSENGDQDGTE
ncbi:hypothetical protein [Glutamicibacter nicotianae]|uniref:hypothetical protein n=1 Tax=Glutamicibacter nicotianae TaxID=37929 RepID=UPI00167FCA9D|nr:hypothetical protein [Glutamicibacter nicotianae]